MNAVDKSIEQHHLDNALAQLDDASQNFIEGLHHELVQLREQEEETERMIRVLSLRCDSYKNEVDRWESKLTQLREVTPNMLKAAQLGSELGEIATSGYVGAYHIMTEMYQVMFDAAGKENTNETND